VEKITEMKKFKSDQSLQKEKTSKTLEVMLGFGLRTKPTQEVEFFFYADNENDASNLAIELHNLGCEIECVDNSAGRADIWLVSGWTSAMPMDEDSLTKWAEAMDKLAASNRCTFDGWGTFADLNEQPI
jgi:regulator of RNase E activity RraB